MSTPDKFTPGPWRSGTTMNTKPEKPLRGKALFMAALRHIEEHPDQWDQRFPCVYEGVCCLLGHAAMLSGLRTAPAEYAGDLCDLSYVEWEYIYAPERTLADFRRFAKRKWGRKSAKKGK